MRVGRFVLLFGGMCLALFGVVEAVADAVAEGDEDRLAGLDRPFDRSAIVPPWPVTETRTPCAGYDANRRPFFGDTHVHTALSFDAWGQGTRGRPDDAYRFAKGEAIGIQPYDEKGEPARLVELRRPLDFAVITDHAELMGETHICTTPGVEGYDSLLCRFNRFFPKLGYMAVNSRVFQAVGLPRYSMCGADGRHCPVELGLAIVLE